MKKQIENREDVTLLVHSFYKKIRENEEIKDFFNSIEDWDSHLEKLIDFWENNLFAKRLYFGNPMTAHIKVDELHDFKVSPNEFGLWLNLWFETLDEYFEGENVEILKRRARKMATNLYLNIFENRGKYQIENAQTNT